MKKVILIILFCGIMVLSLTGCENNSSESKAIIIDNDGNTVEMTANELIEIYKQNNAKFEKNYERAKIEITDEVEKVTTNVSGNASIELKGNWQIMLKSKSYDLSRLASGDRIHIISYIYTIGSGERTVAIYGDEITYGSNLEDEIKIEILKKK